MAETLLTVFELVQDYQLRSHKNVWGWFTFPALVADIIESADNSFSQSDISYSLKLTLQDQPEI